MDEETKGKVNKMTPLGAVRKYCLWCMNGQAKEVRLCSTTDCALYLLRSGHKEGNKISTLKAIRLQCLDCSAGNTAEVRRCWDKDVCVLYSYRMGHNPKLAGKGNPDALRRWAAEQEASNLLSDSEPSG